MTFYIVTPAYNALSWLQRCIYSVADQVAEGVEVHHHIQDGGHQMERLSGWRTGRKNKFPGLGIPLHMKAPKTPACMMP